MVKQKGQLFELDAQTLSITSIYSGYMHKKAKNGVVWRKRYFVLMPDKVLHYFATNTDTKSLGKIEMGKVIRIVATSKPKKHGIDIEFETRSYFFYCDSDKEQQQWVDALNRTKMEAQQLTPPANSVPPSLRSSFISKSSSFLIKQIAPPPSPRSEYGVPSEEVIKETKALEKKKRTELLIYKLKENSLYDEQKIQAKQRKRLALPYESDVSANHNSKHQSGVEKIYVQPVAVSEARKRKVSVIAPSPSNKRDLNQDLSKQLTQWKSWAISSMRDGCVVYKYPYMHLCSGKPKRRFFQLSPEHDAIIWGTRKSPDDTEILNRKIAVSQLQRVIFGPYSATFSLYLSEQIPKRRNCLSIVVSQTATKQRTIDLVFENENDVLPWYIGIQHLIDKKVLERTTLNNSNGNENNQSLMELNLSLQAKIDQFKWTKLRLELEENSINNQVSIVEHVQQHIAKLDGEEEIE